MGNRGNVVFVAGERISPTIYLHWNGGPESVYAFLRELDRRGVRADGEYEAARFVQIVGEFFDYSGTEPQHSGLSLGIIAGPTAITPEALAEVFTDAGDNGFYVVERGSGEPLKRETTVRRFSGFPLKELTPEEVAEEKLDAELNIVKHGPDIAKFFSKLDEKTGAMKVSTLS
jgi:hypothetical protein